MALSTILRKLRILKPLPKKEPLSINKDAKAVLDFLINMEYDRDRLLRLVKRFLELRIDYYALQDEEPKKSNFRQQINLFDEIIQVYSFYQGDADINGKRIKNIAKLLKEKAIKSEDIELIDKTSKLRWKFDW
ncbi:MAG: hypothetical protein KAT77_02820 [Nanoarchaeota archaeon]|nr:hypothetical protein [Nanoarchaeota archaeon]